MSITISLVMVIQRRLKSYILSGAFVAAPIGGLLWALGAFALRLGFTWVTAKIKGHRFDAFDRPPSPTPIAYTGGQEESSDEGRDEPEAVLRVKPHKRIHLSSQAI